MSHRWLIARGVVVNGPAPVAGAFVPRRDDLIVLYGRNGSGKSRLLRGLLECLGAVNDLPNEFDGSLLWFDFVSRDEDPALGHDCS